MDEVHYLADRFRGAVWEEVIIGLAESIQVVALSATVSNAEEFGDWLSEVRGEMAVVVSERRPVPLFQHVLVGNTALRPVRRRGAHRAGAAQPANRGQPGPGPGRQGGVPLRPRRLPPAPGPRRQGQADGRYGSGAYGGAAHRSRDRAVGAGRPRSLAVAPPAGDGRAARRRGPAAGDRVHLLPGRLRRRGRPAARRPGLRLTSPGRAAGDRRDRRPARRRTVRRRPPRARLRPVRRGAAPRHRRAPRRHAARLQGVRRGGVRQRA